MQSLEQLSPTGLENLTFDLLRSTGMRNVQWRTPGSDGGRDIEGEYLERDFAGGARSTRWFVDAKRYQSSVSWPIVWEKVAYATAQMADYLLIVATNSASPQCIDNINKWNASNVRPIIRFWGAHELEFRLTQVPHLRAKYGLAEIGELKLFPLERSQTALHRLIASANDSLSLTGKAGRYMEAAVGLSEFLARSSRAFGAGVDVSAYRCTDNRSASFPWLTLDPDLDLSSFDAVYLRALLPLLAVSEGIASATLSSSDRSTLHLVIQSKRAIAFPTLDELVAELDIWSDAETSKVDEDSYQISLRDKR